MSTRRCTRLVGRLVDRLVGWSVTRTYDVATSTFLTLDSPLLIDLPHTHKPTPFFRQVMESFMARKPPTQEDLRDLLPVVWWPGCRDETASETRMKVGVESSRR